MATDPRSGASIIAVDACWALLRSTPVGRLALSVADRPDIFPVNYVVDHGTAVIRTGVGAKLGAIASSPKVAFEADGYDEVTSEAWSVVIKGCAEDVRRMYELLDTAALPIFPWQGGTKGHFLRIVPEVVSGRRFKVLDSAAWRNTMMDAPRSSDE
jgi:nitroimidazol reductase NimA-like FMN-containing flavoprotein (pyridoxamine 5'-phosphate oxidase superfamily)